MERIQAHIPVLEEVGVLLLFEAAFFGLAHQLDELVEAGQGEVWEGVVVVVLKLVD